MTRSRSSLVAWGRGPSFKWVTTVHKQTTNLISSLFTALRQSPGRLINIRDPPNRAVSEEEGARDHSPIVREERSGRHVRQMGALIDEGGLGHSEPAPPPPQTQEHQTRRHIVVPQDRTNRDCVWVCKHAICFTHGLTSRQQHSYYKPP